MSVIGGPLLQLIHTIIRLYIWLVIIDVILNWLILFNIVNPYNKFVMAVKNFAVRATDPLLNPIRRLIPSFNGLDLSPLILILLLYFVEGILNNLILKVIL